MLWLNKFMILLTSSAAIFMSVNARSFTKTIAFAQNNDVFNDSLKPINRRKRQQITFSGNATFFSDPFSIQDLSQIHDYFKSNQNLKFLFPGSEGFQLLEPTKQHRNMYDKICSDNKEVGKLTTCFNEEKKGKVLLMKSPGVNFPGLTCKSMNTFWLNMHNSAITEKAHRDCSETYKECTDMLLPYYELNLIDSYQIAEGSRPFVWIFNKFVKGQKKVKSADHSIESETKTFSTQNIGSKILSMDNIDGKKSVAFSNYVEINIAFSISNSLAKMIPMSLQSFQERGSKTIQKLIDSNAKLGIQQFRDAFVKWIGTVE